MSILIKKAENSDTKDIFNWRNDKQTISMFKNNNIVSWNEHCLWFKKKIKDKSCLLLIGEKASIKIGVIRFDILRDHSAISINLNPVCRGKKYSKTFLVMGCNYYFSLFNLKIISEIKKVNLSSINIFKSVGFKRESIKENFLIYTLESKTTLKV